MGSRELEEAFGELRSMAHHNESIDASRWRAFLSSARALDPASYDARWLPYLAGASLPTFKFSSVATCLAFLPCLPEGASIRFVSQLDLEALEEFLAASGSTKITRLDLSHARIDNVGLQRLTHSPLATTLRALDLRDNALGAPGIDAMANDAEWLALERLVLSDNALGDVAAALLAKTLHAPKLTYLDLSRNNFRDHGLDLIRQSDALGKIFVLT